MTGADPASFRDPAGFVFWHQGQVYRQVNEAYRGEWARLKSSGLLDQLWASGQLIPHVEASLSLAAAPGAIAILQPEQVDTVSYPYEWCFSQLKAAAILTLNVQKAAISVGLSLKDASAYNVQFHRGRPVFIDTLSFEPYVDGQPWVAYRQFCQHFLAPLALMAKLDIRLSQLLRVHIDGVPLDLASKLLPAGSWFSPSLLMHVHLHAKSQQRHAADAAGAGVAKPPTIARATLEGIFDSLKSAVEALDWSPTGTEWADYYQANNNYGDQGLQHKADSLGRMLDGLRPATAWDIGGNTGRFSRVAAQRGAQVVTWDVDPACVEANWRQVQTAKEKNVLPLLLDLTNPSPGLGWASTERRSMAGRGPVDCVLALGLVHHIALSNNVPLDRVGAFFASVGKNLILEFVPKDDSQVVKLLASRPDIFPHYHRAGLEAAFGPYFELCEAVDIPATCRTLYRFRTK